MFFKFGIFLDGLKQFHKSIEADYADIRAGKEIHKPRNVWVAVENRKKRIVEAYTPGNNIYRIFGKHGRQFDFVILSLLIVEIKKC